MNAEKAPPQENKRKTDYPPVISARISKQMMAAVEQVVEQEFYFGVSDYLRDIIKKDLESRGKFP